MKLIITDCDRVETTVLPQGSIRVSAVPTREDLPPDHIFLTNHAALVLHGQLGSALKRSGTL